MYLFVLPVDLNLCLIALLKKKKKRSFHFTNFGICPIFVRIVQKLKETLSGFSEIEAGRFRGELSFLCRKEPRLFLEVMSLVTQPDVSASRVL